ncbi:predicted protein [Postia placenta Mad-698-R]|uniref:Uncharacterized protein n=1 Tax=Postia placenta MAD-698-R-SB12 TaxID=670580 RepID=A0A1X6MXP1_9APHY|nr:hypothetical protein POSPLADRAFT_1047300 [Postia placenta MAD-698-R-SB12]EED85650.1 predicted protein [Postia placenta Mad-698-R]OSX61010.1 hypothetical protein POSPLADRAFT_1047300 [Postia placenta MAD-698-R-SB12]
MEPQWTTLEESTSISQVGEPSSSKRAPQKRLPAAGKTLVNELYALHPYPPTELKETYLKRIRALPGCDYYTLDKLNLLLYSRRVRSGLAGNGGRQLDVHQPTRQTTSDDILYPSFRKQTGVVSKLEVLISEKPRANDTLIKIWAKRLDVEEDDVLTWVEAWRAEHEEATSSVEPARQSAPVAHLPTPGSSRSPEPLFVHIPLAAKQELSALLTPSEPFFEHGIPSKSSPTDELRRFIRSLPTVDVPDLEPPDFENASVEVINKWFDGHTERMSMFLRHVESGRYKRYGLKPSFLKTSRESTKQEETGVPSRFDQRIGPPSPNLVRIVRSDG